jgi:hypothetical protein
MIKRIILPAIIILTGAKSFSQKSISAVVDSLPESQIDIPITVNLRPFYKLAEKKVDTLFTSPGYPEGWIQEDCSTRYKYHFRRSPLKMAASGTNFNLSFTGYYQITGSSRVCVNGTALSPWTPECACGFKEPERRVNIGFNSSFKLMTNYLLLTKMTRTEPQAIDKCTVCFWGQDITNTVLDGLKKELDASKKTMEDSFGKINLRPFVQQAWNKLNTVYEIPGAGYLALHPKKLRMENIAAKNDFLNISIGISATPVISLGKPGLSSTPVPDLTSTKNPGGFNIYLEAALQYDSLSQVLNTYLMHKRFDVTEGLFKKYIVIENTKVSGDSNGNMVISLDFSGSFRGSVNFTGKPVYDAATKTIVIKDMDYDLQTKSILLKTAKWLFNKRITTELKNYTSFNMSSYYDTASKTLNQWLNREWMKGISGSGKIDDLKLTAVYALPEHLLIRTNCTGKLAVAVNEIELSF